MDSWLRTSCFVLWGKVRSWRQPSPRLHKWLLNRRLARPYLTEGQPAAAVAPLPAASNAASSEAAGGSLRERREPPRNLAQW